jgi:hypothetical protein
MIELYYKTAAGIGYSNPPPVFLVNLPNGVLAQQVRTWRGEGFKTRNIQDRVEIDPKQLTPDWDQVAVIAHELAHWRCRWVFGGGGKTEHDNQNHNASFLACWLVHLKRLGYSEVDVIGAAWHHSSSYRMTAEHTELAIKAASETEDPDAAAFAAIIHIPQKLWETLLLTAIGCAFTAYYAFNLYNQFWR